MTRDELHHGIRILHCLDFNDAKFALGVTAPKGPNGLPNPESLWARWTKMRADPVTYFISCDDETCDALFSLVARKLHKLSLVKHG